MDGFLDRVRSWFAGSLQQDHAPPVCPTREELHYDFERRGYGYGLLEPELRKTDPRLADWIGTIDHYGRVRERTLRHLIDHYQPGDENRILLRLADWVREVRSVASEWTLSNFRSLPLSAIQDNQRLLLYLARRVHLVGDPALTLIHDDLVSRLESEGQPFVASCMPEFRLHLYELAAARAPHEWLLDDSDPRVRLLLLSRSHLPTLTADESARLRRDRSLTVRRAWLTQHSKAGKALEREELVELAFDTNRGLRGIARFYLERDFQEDVDALYRSAEGDAFFLIADLQKPEDLPHFLEALRSKRSSVRVLGMRAICACCPEALRDLDPHTLLCDTRRIRALAMRHLPAQLGLSELEAIGPAVVGEGLFLKMVLSKSIWRFLELALPKVLETASPALLEQVSQAVKRSLAAPPVDEQRRASLMRLAEQLMEGDSTRWREVGERLQFMVRTAPSASVPRSDG